MKSLFWHSLINFPLPPHKTNCSLSHSLFAHPPSSYQPKPHPLFYCSLLSTHSLHDLLFLHSPISLHTLPTHTPYTLSSRNFFLWFLNWRHLKWMLSRNLSGWTLRRVLTWRTFLNRKLSQSHFISHSRLTVTLYTHPPKRTLVTPAQSPKRFPLMKNLWCFLLAKRSSRFVQLFIFF